MTEVFMEYVLLQYGFIVTDFCLFLWSVIGNLVVIYVMLCDKKLNSKANYHVLSVATADLLHGLVGIPLTWYNGFTRAPHDLLPCLMLNSFLGAVFMIPLFSLVAVSVDRYWAVCHPLSYYVAGPRSTKIVICMCWIFGTLVAFLPAFGWHNGQFDGTCNMKLLFDFNYMLFLLLTMSTPSTIAISVLYYLVYRTVLKQSRNRQGIVANSNESERQRMEIRAANTFAMIVGTFVLLWTPAIINNLVMSFTENREFPDGYLMLSTILVHLNTAVDPIIYAYRMNNVRQSIKKFFKCCKGSENAEVSVTVSL